MGTRPTFLRGYEASIERCRRLGWLGLWLIAKRGLRAWLTAPVSTLTLLPDDTGGARVKRHDPANGN